MSANHSVKTRSQARKSAAWREVMDCTEKGDHRYFFSTETMALFNSVLVGQPYTLPYDHRTFFVTGDANVSDKRLYTVRVLDKETGRVDTVSDLYQYGTPMEAIAARNAIVGYE